MLYDDNKTARNAHAVRNLVYSGYDSIGLEAGVIAMAERMLYIDDEKRERHDQCYRILSLRIWTASEAGGFG